MKFRIIAFLLALSVSTWAQTAALNDPAQSTPQAPKAQCACCDKASENGAGCCHHAKGHDEKDAASCCAGKEGAGCCGKGMKCEKPESTAKDSGCCGEKGCCGDGKSCCGKTEATKASMECCKGMHCERHHATDHPSSGN